MSFILRATLVIGALTYFAAQRLGQPVDAAGLVAGLEAGHTDAAVAWTAVPAEARERIAREGAASLGLRLATLPPSRDTLADSDRRPAWHGAER